VARRRAGASTVRARKRSVRGGPASRHRRRRRPRDRRERSGVRHRVVCRDGAERWQDALDPDARGLHGVTAAPRLDSSPQGRLRCRRVSGSHRRNERRARLAGALRLSGHPRHSRQAGLRRPADAPPGAHGAGSGRASHRLRDGARPVPVRLGEPGDAANDLSPTACAAPGHACSGASARAFGTSSRSGDCTRACACGSGSAARSEVAADRLGRGWGRPRLRSRPTARACDRSAGGPDPGCRDAPADPAAETGGSARTPAYSAADHGPERRQRAAGSESDALAYPRDRLRSPCSACCGRSSASSSESCRAFPADVPTGERTFTLVSPEPSRSGGGSGLRPAGARPATPAPAERTMSGDCRPGPAAYHLSRCGST
jgi:hypothetical protein